MTSPVISVIIPTCNRPEKLADTISCLRRQTLAASVYEIIVVDDGSSPPVTLSNDPEGPNHRLVRLEGLERSAARNAGAAAAKGRILVFIDDDIQVTPDFLGAHLKAHQQWPASLAVGAIRLPARFQSTPFGRFRHRLEQQEVPHDRGIVAMPNFCAAGNMSVPRAIFEELHGFDLGIASSEDQDLALRHTAVGGQIVFIPEAVGLHCDSALDIRSYCKRFEWGSEQMMPFCCRYPDRPDNIEREEINGWVCWGREPIRQILIKVLKSMLGLKPITPILFAGVALLERVAPSSCLLDKAYRVLLGTHIQRGYRRGLKRYSTPAQSSSVVSEFPVKSAS